MKVEIFTERFLLRPLDESDVSERYLGWMQDPEARKYISATAHTRQLADLTMYVRERSGRADVLFLGIFDRQTGLHLGNIKYEPVDSQSGDATMGILIGDAAYRGKAVTAEVVAASGQWLKSNRGIRRIVLGVSKDNQSAIRAYERAGFIVSETPLIAPDSPNVVTMLRVL